MQTAISATPSLPIQATLLTLNRTVMNTSFRMMYPLLPVFARALDVDIEWIAGILTATLLTGLVAPLMGTLSERYNSRLTILVGTGLVVVGMTMVFIFPNFGGLAAALVIASVGKMTFDPAVLAYVGERVPYERRGRILGLMELGWSGAFILGVPAMTWLLGRFGWQAPFAAIGTVALILLVIAAQMLESDPPKTENRPNFLQSFRVAISTRAAVAGLVLGFGMSAANQLVSVVFGAWIEASFGVLLSALAAAALVIGLSELLGEGLVAGFADRIGKRRLVALGLSGNLLASLILPFTNFSLAAALVGLFFFYLTFEISLVGTIPLATEMNPAARAMYLTVIVMTFMLSRAIVTPLAPFIFDLGLMANGLLAAAFNAMALVALLGFIRVD